MTTKASLFLLSIFFAVACPLIKVFVWSVVLTISSRYLQIVIITFRLKTVLECYVDVPFHFLFFSACCLCNCDVASIFGQGKIIQFAHYNKENSWYDENNRDGIKRNSSSLNDRISESNRLEYPRHKRAASPDGLQNERSVNNLEDQYHFLFTRATCGSQSLGFGSVFFFYVETCDQDLAITSSRQALRI